MRLRLRARGGAPADLAWERYAQLRWWPTWSPQISTVLAAGGQDDLAPGLTGAVEGPLRLRVTFVVDAVDDVGRTWAWRVLPERALLPLPGPVRRWARLALHHDVRRRGAGSSTGLVVEGAAPVVLAYALPALLAMRRLVSDAPPRP